MEKVDEPIIESSNLKQFGVTGNLKLQLFPIAKNEILLRFENLSDNYDGIDDSEAAINLPGIVRSLA